MNDTSSGSDASSDPGTPRSVSIAPAKSGGFSGLSLVWLIPVFAILAAVGVAWQNWADRGPLIEVVFAQADGVRAQETEVRYRDIPVGVVEEVNFSDDLDQVIVSIRLDKDIARYVDSDALFWIVRPEVTAQGVSGLDTVLSGVYISASWDGTPGTPADRFTGAVDSPLMALGEEGTTFLLRSEDGLPNEGTPILYRGVQVGRMGRTEVSDDGLEVYAQAVILEPYTQLVTSSARFWNISGFRFSLGAEGANLDFSSLASLISGGVTFETMSSGGAPLTEGQEFTLHEDENAAREDFFLEGDGGSVQLMMIFDENLAGLSQGAAVTLGGLKLGEVETISGVVDPLRFGDNEIRLIATARINPSRIGIDTGAGEEAFLAYLGARVNEGLRARLANASILTGGLKIDLVIVEGARQASFNRNADPYPELPTAPSEVTNVAASAQGLIQRVDALPVEEVMNGIIDTLADIRGVIGSDEVQAAPEALLATLESIRQIAESEEVAGLPAQIGTLADNLTEASGTLNTLMGQVQDEAVVAAISGLIDSLDETAQTLPGLSERAGAVLAKAEALPLEDIATQISDILSDENLTALPAELRGTVEGLRGIVESPEFAALPGQVGSLADGLNEASATLNTLLGQVKDEAVVAAVSELIASLDETAQSLPSLSERANAVLGKAEALPLDDISTRITTLLDDADALLADPDLRALPADVRATLDGLRQVVASEEFAALPAQVGDLASGLGDASDKLNALLEEAQQQAIITQVSELINNLGTTADRLPGLADQASAVLNDAEQLSLDELATQARSLLDSVERLVDQDSTRQLPSEVNAALSELRLTLEELRSGGIVANANATLASAREAAEAVAVASRSLPELSNRLRVVADQAGVTISGYNANSDFARSLSSAIRQIDEAAKSIDRLAKQIARNPNSLITGR
ncbi:paraquat-inducible protein B [Sagittula marina]|uniref:Paraquat-inducible protein B n=1 Tax=Sagittula marina TaxID=943940 RepID=A0A7W6GU92_9RHOB|nr:MlaD family protein [Sagittula marina]MBB3988336.1 paraquat-inducible protein B [Sagittula marina]